MGTYSDDDVGKPILKDDGRQSEAQRRVLGEAGHETGQGGSSRGTGDRRQSADGDRAAPGRPTGRHSEPKPGEG